MVVPPVLDIIVRAAAAEVLGDARPVGPVIRVQPPDEIVLLGRPGRLHKARVEVVLEALPALPARLPGHELRNLVPIRILLLPDCVHYALIVCRTEVMTRLFEVEKLRDRIIGARRSTVRSGVSWHSGKLSLNPATASEFH
jgi:hypothetical protein